MSRAFVRGKNSITVAYDGNTYTVPVGPQYDLILQAIKEDRWEDIPNLIDKGKAVEQYSNGSITVKDGLVSIDGDQLPSDLNETILNFMDEGAPYEPLVKFWKRLRLNPSYRAVKELYGFLSAANIPILDDGRILCYKAVRLENRVYRNPGTHTYGNVTVRTNKGVVEFKDIHSGKVLQGIGDVVSMPRNKVNEDSSVTCSHGLHVCSWSYLPHFGNFTSGDDVVVEVAVDPKDVVAIPIDYNNAKMRCSEYEILGINKGLTERRQSYVSYTEYPEYESGYDEDDDDDDYLFDEGYQSSHW